MAVINPPGFLQNAGATHTAEQFRNHLGSLTAGKQSSTSLIPRGGVNPALGNALQVTQAGAPSMNVVVKSGHAVIPGSEGTKQGVYTVCNDADVTLAIAASHATLNRIDLVVFKVEDSAYSGVANTSSLAVVTGTPAGSPVAPSAPNNSIILAQVSIVALDTSITNGEITDRRHYVAAVGGIIQCTSTTRPAANTVTDGQVLYETDTDRMMITHNAGTAWHPIGPLGILTHATVTASVGPTSGTTELDLITASAVTPVTATRRIKITLQVNSFQATSAGDIFQISIKEGGTVLGETRYTPPGTSQTGIGTVLVAIVDSPTAAAHTYKATIVRLSGAGTATALASGTGPIKLIVEDCG